MQLFLQLSPAWKVGFQVDYSSGAIDVSRPSDTELVRRSSRSSRSTPSTLTSTLSPTTSPAARAATFVPFLYGGVGIAYEEDTTTLTLTNDYIDEYLLVENDGFFPSYSAGVGFDWYSASSDSGMSSSAAPTCGHG